MALSDEILADLKAKKGGGKPPPMKPGNAKEDAADGGADDAEESGGYASDEESIAGDMLSAVKSGDASALAEAVKAFIDVCRPQG